MNVLTGEKEMDEQGGFKVRRYCMDQVFLVTQVVEKTIEKNKRA